MKQQMNPKYSMARRMEHMLHTAWKTLRQMPVMCLMRTDSPSQRVVVTASAWCGAMPLLSDCQTIICRNTGEEPVPV